ncbi:MULTISPECIES: gamma-glutamyltransferase family protein [Rhodobacterales]|jgi:gamma-glutamyltranspeptidase/glutathione hydrolase|uniref:gamma-glutamyltransferase family protein n=1 Tax=Rhodobacterales TaxID=204455 RepID=UPI00237F0497|nr:gamma-glutamyltransferase family protein [Phaeobacter gallaeciensis]MDE4141585.1 gamma-glutamyltransferase family protein [Phaeobacter gallaeciensis]MDE4150030.1 gamma-glutamyltransferase family protein [Phaeobacter gallaeciensis]MDE4154256.1 gamma-glutamyltransferase family protein [Phaeobacter gallaeciensis]MDE4229575.1 gamma-glutamyltransferase family protein [Phaeobacter gallaeciensis]MDE4258722.1 gamma-glutamyltransferase family protein [Phaeobacter gallaeciensis]
MSDFTTRPEIRGTFGVATSTHWIASTVGMSILEKGGNAFDAAVATALVLQVVEPHLNGPAGDMPAIFHKAETGETKVVCAQGVAPKAATIEAYTEQGLTLIPGSGLLATVVPGAFDGWMMMLRDHGTMSLREVLEPVIGYARDGHPVLPRVANTIAGLQEFFETEWPTSAAVWAPGGEAPKPNALFKNPDLARTYERLAEAGEAAGEDRVAQIDAARTEWREGFVAEAIFDYLKEAHVMDVSDEKHSAVLAPDDLKDWRATYEDTLSYEYEGWTVHKTHAWSQGPVMLQGLAILKGFDLGAMDPFGAEFVHTVTEAMKLAYADREAYYGDPAQSEIPMEYLLSEEYNAERRKLITDKASTEQRPGRVPGFEHLADAYVERAARDFNVGQVAAQEPTMSHLTEKRGDTVHLDVIDRWGNMVAATPSGGWLQSSPVIPGLGFPLNSRAQMFWLEDGLPTSLAPGRRPRTTLTPSYAEKDGVQMVFGTPGGDQQDQWQLIWFLRFVHFGMELQQCMDAPLFHSMHFQGSFFPREVRTAEMMVEPNFGEAVIADLRARGHNVVVADPWTVGRLTAALREPDGMLRAAATPRLMQAYAVGR